MSLSARARTPGYVLHFVPGGAGHNPADGTTYYVNGFPASPLTGTGGVRLLVPMAGTITAASINFSVSGTLGSGESATVALLVSGTTAVALSSAVVFSSLNNPYNFSGLSQAVVAGDYLEIRIITPTWATNPTTVIYAGSVFIELP